MDFGVGGTATDEYSCTKVVARGIQIVFQNGICISFSLRISKKAVLSNQRCFMGTNTLYSHGKINATFLKKKKLSIKRKRK